MSYVYLERKPASGIYRCRGLLQESDDLASFQKKMKAKGYDVFPSESHLGREIKVTVEENGEKSIEVVEV